MKIFKLLSMIAVITVISFTSCKDDETISDNEQLANAQNALENTKIPASILEAGIQISRASKETGTPPAPNSDFDFQMSSDQQEAFQSTGLRIAFSSDERVAGAYIQFKDSEGNPTSSYYDVSAFTSSHRPVRKKYGNGKFNSISRKSFRDDEFEVQVNFSELVPAGQFCYDICLYNDSEEISQILTRCVTVESWGGNAELVGEWVLDQSSFDEDLQEERDAVYCEEGEEPIEVAYQLYLKNDFIFVLNADGTYYNIRDVESQYLDYESTQENCEATYYDELEKENVKISGFWAYNEEEATLAIVDFKFEDLLDSDPEGNEISDEGNLAFAGVKTEIVEGRLVLTQTFEGDTQKLYFDRK